MSIIQRSGSITRTTKETDITASVTIEGTGTYDISTGVGFLDHLLEQLARHSLMDITLHAKGDLHIDTHHTTEDCALTLGEAIAKALGDKRGIRRYGQAYAPMDDVLARAAVDLSGRPFDVWRVDFTQPRLGALDTEMIGHFVHSLAMSMKANIHVEVLYGHNNHHKAEGSFKALARALGEAMQVRPEHAELMPSTKGVI